MDRMPRFNKPIYSCIYGCTRTTTAPDGICSRCRYEERRRVENLIAGRIRFYQKQAERLQMVANQQEDALETLETEKEKYDATVDESEQLTETRLQSILTQKPSPRKNTPARKPLNKKDFVLDEAVEDNRPEEEIEAEGDLLAVLRKKRECDHARSNKTARGGKISSARGRSGCGKIRIDTSQPTKEAQPSKSIQTQTHNPKPTQPAKTSAPKPSAPDNEFHETIDSETAAGQFIEGVERNHGLESEMEVEDSIEDLLSFEDEEDTSKVAKDLFDLSFQN